MKVQRNPMAGKRILSLDSNSKIIGTIFSNNSIDMKNFLITFLFLISIAETAVAQSARGVRIGYIDMEYILQNVPDYAEANNQLELKAQKWKQELDVKKSEIVKLQESLKIEKALLTKELIEEREEAIGFLEAEMSEIQQKHFGPNGDFVTQKEMLVKPIQDQIFNAVQDLAEKKKYDFIFDKSSDLTMLFAAKRFNVSDQVIKVIERAGKAEQRSKKQIKADDARELREDMEADNPALVEKKKAQADRQEALLAKQAERKAAFEKTKADADARRQQILADREAKKTGQAAKKAIGSTTSTTTTAGQATGTTTADDAKTAAQQVADQKAADREAIKAAKQKDFEDRRKAIEDRKAKTLEDRAAAKKLRDEQKNGVAPKQ